MAIEAELGVAPSGTAATVAARLDADAAALTAHTSDTSDAHDASAVSVAAISGLSATDAQAALAELRGQVQTVESTRVVNVEDYIASMASVGEAIDAAMAAATLNWTAAGVVEFKPAKTYLLDGTIPKIKRNLPGLLTIDLKGATVKLTAACPRMFTFDKVANDDTFQNLHLCNGTVDADNIGGKHYIILGTYINGAAQGRVQFTNITVENINGINGCPPDPTDTNNRRWFAISPQNNAADPLLTVRDITFRNVHLSGGSCGFNVAAFRLASGVSDYANVFHDEIIVDDCSHDTGIIPTAFSVDSNVHIAGRGYGRRCLVRNFVGKGSGDVGIEIDSMLDSTVRDCKIEDQWGIAYLVANSAQIPNLRAQRYLFSACRAIRRNQNTNLTSTFGWFSTIIAGYAPATVPYITKLDLRDCTYHKLDGTFHISGEALAFDNTRRITIDGFDIVYESVVAAEAVTVYQPTAIKVRNGVAAAAMGVCTFDARRLTLRVEGQRTGAAAVLFRPILFSNIGEVAFDIDGLDIDVDVTALGSTGFRGVYIGDSAAGQTITGRLRNMRWTRIVGDPAPWGLVLEDTAWVTVPVPIEMSNCDFSRVGGGIEVVYRTSGGGTAQKTKILTSQNRSINGPTSMLRVGEDVFDRKLAQSSAAMTSGILRVTYFRAEVTEPITQLLLTSAGTAAGATPTLVRAGIYSVDPTDWSLTALLAAITNDTTIFAAANTEYPRALTATFNKIRGTWYAFAQLVVTAAAAPTVPIATLGSSRLSVATQNREPIAVGISGQTDLPTSVASPLGSLTTAAPYGRLVP